MELLTIPKISKLLNVPESNLRYYLSKFQNYIPEVADGKHRRFKPEAVEVFKFIAESFKAGSSSEHVEEELQKRFSITVEVEEEPQQVQTTNQQVELLRAMIKESIREVVQEEIAAIRNELSAMHEVKEEIATTRNEISTISEIVKEEITTTRNEISTTINDYITESRKERHNKKEGFFASLFKK